MSLADVYQNTKNEKVEQSDKVIYQAQIKEFQKELENLKLRIDSFNMNLSRLEEATKKLESLKMSEFTEKHARMKENYNVLVTQYNQFQVEIKSVVMDLSKRLNNLEAKF